MTSESFICLVLTILLSTSCTVHVSAETCAEVCENCLADTEVTQDVFINGTACTEECEKNIHLGTDNKQFIRAPMWKKCYRLLHELRSKKGPYLIHDVQPVKANWQPAIAVSAVTVLIVFIIITMVTIKLCVKREILRTENFSVGDSCSRPPVNPNGTIATTTLMENMAEEATQKAKQDLI